jgi:hypothetical protein
MALFSCPGCAWRVKITDEDLGKKSKCLQCGQEFVVSSTRAKEVPALPNKPVPVTAQSSETQSLPWLKWVAFAAAIAFVPAIFLVLGLSLSGPPKATVFGKVTFKKKPLSSGAISFLGEFGHSQVTIGKDGSYQIKDAPLGPVKISVRNKREFLQKGAGEKIKWVVKSLIPTKYNDPQSSGLSYTIGSGRQEINIDLKD